MDYGPITQNWEFRKETSIRWKKMSLGSKHAEFEVSLDIYVEQLSMLF